MASSTRSEKLSEYQAKRDFIRTPEPSGKGEGRAPKGRHRFVVQRHRARRLHVRGACSGGLSGSKHPVRFPLKIKPGARTADL